MSQVFDEVGSVGGAKLDRQLSVAECVWAARMSGKNLELELVRCDVRGREVARIEKVSPLDGLREGMAWGRDGRMAYLCGDGVFVVFRDQMRMELTMVR